MNASAVAEAQSTQSPESSAPDAPDVALPPLPSAWTSLAAAFVRSARAHAKLPALADSAKAKLDYGGVLLRSLALGRALGRALGDEKNIGVFMPPTVPTAVVNVALALLGKVPVNLNYSASKDLIDQSIEQAGIKHVITATRVLEKFKFKPAGELILLEELAKRVSAVDKAWALLVAKAAPLPLLKRLLPGIRKVGLDDAATIIFTSGSTGDPKGVVLSHRNILSNVFQIENQIDLTPDESILGVLPFFHSFGFTVCLWTVLCLGKRAVYHVNPLEGRVVGGLCKEHKCTLLLCTPTFMRNYLSRSEPGSFASLRLLVLGAEKLRPELAAEIRAQLGIEPLEGYGCTELSPVVAVNVPHDRPTRRGERIAGNRPGTVGMPLPGTAIRTVDPDTDEPLPRGKEGMVLVKGPQVMVGYLNKPEATANAVRGGWYVTGDLGYQDDDGFLRITDRLSRFSKIGGEMVSHLKVELAILQVTGRDETAAAVTSLPDPKRGEKLVVVYTDLGATPREVCDKLGGLGLPKLWLPAAEDFVQVEAVPALGSGKLDLRRLKEAAEHGLKTRD